MNVIDEDPESWVLLHSADGYFMEAISGISFQPISVVVKLDDNQVAKILSEGRAACQAIAVEVADNWLLYADPDEAYDKAVHEAIRAWRAAGVA